MERRKLLFYAILTGGAVAATQAKDLLTYPFAICKQVMIALETVARTTLVSFGPRKRISGDVVYEKEGLAGDEGIDVPPYYVAVLRTSDGTYIAAVWARWLSKGIAEGRNYALQERRRMSEEIAPPDRLELEVRQVRFQGKPVEIEHEEKTTGQRYRARVMDVHQIYRHVKRHV